MSVTVEDVNDNPPEFDQPSYSVTLLENSPVDAVLFKAVVIDLDQVGCYLKPHFYIIIIIIIIIKSFLP